MTGEMFAIAGKMRIPTYRGTKYEPLQLLCDTPQEVSEVNGGGCGLKKIFGALEIIPTTAPRGLLRPVFCFITV